MHSLPILSLVSSKCNSSLLIISSNLYLFRKSIVFFISYIDIEKEIEKEIDSREKSERKDSNTLTQLDFDQYTRKFYELYDMYPNHEYKEKALK